MSGIRPMERVPERQSETRAPNTPAFGGGILRGTLPRVPPMKSTSAALPCGWLRGTKPQFRFRQLRRPRETLLGAGAIRHTTSVLQTFRPVCPPLVLLQELRWYHARKPQNCRGPSQTLTQKRDDRAPVIFWKSLKPTRLVRSACRDLAVMRSHALGFDRFRLFYFRCLEFSSTASSRSNIMCFSLLTVVPLVVGRCGVADAAASGSQTSRASISDARSNRGQFRAPGEMI